MFVIFASMLSGCGELGEQLGLSEKKEKGTPRSCYGLFYDPVEDVYTDGHGRQNYSCIEDLNSIQYRVFLNVCTGGDEIVGYNTDSSGQRQYCSNSRCNMEDRKRGYRVMENGIRIECGFSVPSYIQQYYQGYNTGYQYQQPSGSYRPYGYQQNNQWGYNPYTYRTY
tara:strand:+ start:32902 stop:33402 length:501 start_codon:yes stop_codon:yes gene_type:complete